MRLENCVFSAISREPTDIFELEEWANHDEVLKGFVEDEKKKSKNHGEQFIKWGEWEADLPFLSGDEKECENPFEKRYQEIKDDTDRLYKSVATNICCPHCLHFSPCYDFITPKKTWDYIKKITATDTLKNWIYGHLHFYCRNSHFVLKEAILRYVKYSYNMFVCDDIGAVMICPHCGEKIPLHIKDGYVKEDDVHFCQLTRDESWYEKNIFSYGYRIFDCDKSGEKSGKVTLSEISCHLYPNVRGRLHISKSARRFIFNVGTGQAYMMREIKIPGNKPLYENETRLRNVTYSLRNYCCEIPRDTARELMQTIANEKGINPKVVDEYLALNKKKEKYLNLDEVAIFNRFCAFGADFVHEMREINKHEILSTRTKKWFKDLNEDEQFNRAISRNKISGKKNIRLMAKNPLRILYEKTLKEMGFSDINNIMNIMENATDAIMRIFIDCVSYANPFYIEFNGSDILRFIKAAIGIIGETSFCKKILSFQNILSGHEKGDKGYLFRDSAHLFVRCMDDIEISGAIFKGNIEEIHNRLSLINNSLKKQQWIIPYHESEMMNCVYGDYVFSMAKNSMEMMAVGSKMNICVGSYDNYARTKSCNIVFMYDKKGIPQASIELKQSFEADKNKYKCNQFKDYCNNLVTDQKKAEAAKAFLTENKICFDREYDITQEIINSSYDKELFHRTMDRNGYLMYKEDEELKAKKICRELEIDGVRIIGDNANGRANGTANDNGEELQELLFF